MNHCRARKRADVRRAFGLDTAYATINQPRARKVVSRRTRRVVGYFCSVKAAALVPWESQLEFDFLRLIEVDNSIRTYRSQPESLRYQMDGERHRYYPDFRIEYWDGRTEVVEVKMAEKAAKPEMQELFGIVGELFWKRRIRYRVVTEDDIRQEPLLSNAKALLNLRMVKPSKEVVFRVARAFSQSQPATLGELEEALGASPGLREQLYSLAMRNGFDLDLHSAPLSERTNIISDFNYDMVGG